MKVGLMVAQGNSGQSYGIAGPQQMRDCSLEFPAAGRAATRPT